MNQRTLLLKLITDFCQKRGSRTFTLQELNKTYGNYENIGIRGKTPQATVRRLLQELRDSSFISFHEKRGAYSLRGIEILNEEVEQHRFDFINFKS